MKDGELMPDIEKVIAGLKHCDESGCIGCPYYEDDTYTVGCKLNKDAIKLLKEQQQTIETQRDIIRTQEEQISDLQDENMSHGYSGWDGNIIL